MHGLVSGAILGVAFIAFMGAYRSVSNWKNSAKRPPGWVLGIQVGLQVALGIAGAIFALFVMFVGE